MGVQKISRMPNGLKSTLISGLVLMSCLTAPDTNAWKKSLRFEHLTTEDGLSHVLVGSIAQDQQGFMWFGARNGLNKYDGYRITFYGHDLDNPFSISSGQVMDVFVDSQGVLWAAANKLNRFDRSNETFTHFSHDPEVPGSISGAVLTIFEDHEHILWFGTWDQGLNRYDRASETFEHFRHDPSNPLSLPAGPIRSIYEDSDGVLWVGTYSFDGSANLVRFDRNSRTFQPVLSCSTTQSGCAQPLDEADRPPHPVVAGMLEDRSGTLWIGGQGIIRYNKDSNTYRRYFNDPENDDYPHINNFSGEFVEDQAGLIWFGDTHSGLHSFDPESETFTQYLHNPADPDSIGSNDLFTIFEDRDGLIWVASYFGGVSRFDPQSLAFGHYQHDPDDPTSLGQGGAGKVVEDADGILWTTGEGLNKIDRRNGVIARYGNDPEDPDSLQNKDINQVLFDEQGNLWLGTEDGLYRFDPLLEKFRYFPLKFEGDGTDKTKVLSLIKDKSGMLWLTTADKFFRLDPISEEFLHFPVFTEGSMLSGSNVSSIIDGENEIFWLSSGVSVAKFDATSGQIIHYQLQTESTPKSMGGMYRLMRARNGDIWIRTSMASELIRLDPHTASFTHYRHDPQDEQSLSDSGIVSIYEAGNGDIWLGMETGINRFDPSSGKFTRYQNTNGIRTAQVDAIFEGSNGYMWFTTWGAGLLGHDPSSDEWQVFDRNDGLQSDFLFQGILSQSGEVIIEGENGLNIFDPRALPNLRTEPTVAFTDLRLLNQSVAIGGPVKKTPLSTHINTHPDISLTHRDYLFSFEFAALSYFNPMVTRYAYKLEGFDQDWIETGATNRNATYTNLPAGDFVLNVRATGRNGQWSNNSASLNLKILPPPWKTWWAYSLYLAVFALLLFAFIHIRTVSLRRRAVELEASVNERTHIILEHEQLIQHQADSLQELLHLKEKLYANISHEFRTPLALILGPIRRLLGKNPDTESQEQLQVVQRNSERLLRLVDQLLALSRLSAQEKPSASAQPLVSHVKAMVESFRPLAVDRDLQLATGRLENLWVNCGTDSLEKILMNLLSNAIKYTPAGGKITVEVYSEDDDMARLSVSDTGIGIPSQEHQAVFDRFHRIGNSGETIPGAGIGLALVRELVESFDGSVSLDSTHGQGTTLTVALPRHAVDSAAPDGTKEVVASAATRREVNSLAQPGSETIPIAVEDENGQQTVLVVEDNPDMQNYLQSLLVPDYECLVAGDGHTGLELALEQVPDLVVTDVMMPGLDGYELTEALKEDQRTSHIPIIMLTARSDRESRLKGLSEHADDYLIKPFDDEELLLRITNQLAARDIMKARFSRRVYLEEPLATGLNERERNFLARFETVLEENFADPDLDIGGMASKLAVSTRQLQRKLKALTGHSPAEYLRAYRLKEAARLLGARGQIIKVAFDVGFTSQAYFGTCFKAQFGMSPGQYQRNQSQN